MTICNFECKNVDKVNSCERKIEDNEVRIREIENSLAELKAEVKIYIKQLSDNVIDIKSVIESLKSKQISKETVKETVRETVKEIEESNGKESKMYVIAIELLKMLGTALAIIGGMQVIG